MADEKTILQQQQEKLIQNLNENFIEYTANKQLNLFQDIIYSDDTNS